TAFNQTTSATGWQGPGWDFNYPNQMADDVFAWPNLYQFLPLLLPGLHDVTLATFDDPHSEPASAYTARIEWGDNQVSPGVVVGSNGHYRVLGSTRYTTQGTYTFRVRISDDLNNTASVGGTVTVLAATAGIPVTMTLFSARYDPTD